MKFTIHKWKGEPSVNKPSKGDTLKIIKRIFSYATKKYEWRLILVFVSIGLSAATNAIGISFTKKLIDNYITPMLKQKAPDYGPLLHTILIMGVMYLCGALFTYIYNRSMVTVSQGILKDIREEMFEHMETLPLPYYDQNETSDIMSH